MLKVTCQECNALYHVDESKIQGDHAKFKCSKCSKEILLRNPSKHRASENNELPLSGESPLLLKKVRENLSKDTVDIDPSGSLDGTPSDVPKKMTNRLSLWLNSLSIGEKLLFVFFANVIVIGGVLTLIFMSYIPSLIKEQLILRTYSIAHPFKSSVAEPLLLKNYLKINQTAQFISQLPDVAYVSVLNNKGNTVAGIFSHKDQFDRAFIQKIETSGMPVEISDGNRIPKGSKESIKLFLIGGKRVIDVAIFIEDAEGEIHIGMFTEDIEHALNKSLILLGITLFIITLIGSFGFIFVGKTLSQPIQILTAVAERISVGDLESRVSATGTQEIEGLSNAMEHMRVSLRIAINRLRKR